MNIYLNNATKHPGVEHDPLIEGGSGLIGWDHLLQLVVVVRASIFSSNFTIFLRIVIFFIKLNDFFNLQRQVLSSDYKMQKLDIIVRMS